MTSAKPFACWSDMGTGTLNSKNVYECG